MFLKTIRIRVLVFGLTFLVLVFIAGMLWSAADVGGLADCFTPR